MLSAKWKSDLQNRKSPILKCDCLWSESCETDELLKVLHSGEDVSESEVGERVARRDLQGLQEDVGRVVGAVAAVEDVGEGQQTVVPFQGEMEI